MATQVNPSYPLASLYVGDLDPSITEAMLYERFSTAGQVMSIRVCRDQITKQSLGYAYVNFHQPADAERALDTMNFDLLMGRPMRIMWSQRDPALRKSGVGNVFIKNLDRTIDNKALYDTFSTFGNILSCKIMTDEHANSKGYGFVHFETNEAAEQAIKNVNNMLLNDKKVYVGMFMPKNKRTELFSETTRKFTNVFVKNFGDQMDEQKFRDMFEKYGEITSAVVARGEDGKSKGFGFVNFKEPEAADKAVRDLHDTEYGGKKLFVGRFQKKAERSNVLKKLYEERKQERNNRYTGINLYIKNLDDTIDDEKLRKEFVSFGTITSAKVMTENGRSKGFGFVCFSAPEEATKAVTDMNGRIVGSKPLYVALAQRKDERKNHLASQYMQRLTTTRLQSQQLGQMFANPAATAAAQGIYLPAALQNAAATRFYPAAPSFAAGPPVRPTPRWPGQNAAAAAAAAARGGQVPMPSTYQNYQMLNPSQPRARMPYAPPPGSSAAAAAAQAAAAAALAAGIRPNANGGPQVRMNYNAVNAARGGGMPQQQMNGGVSMPPQPGQPMIQRAGVQNPKFRPPAQAPQAVVTSAGQVMNNIQAINVPGQEPLTTGMLAAAQPQEQKQMLGERLYPLIHSMHPEWAGKITGMLLEIDNAELLHMLDSRESLKAKVEEAVVVLQAHQSKQQQQQQQAAAAAAAAQRQGE